MPNLTAADVAELSGLSLSTVQTLPKRSTLVRGEDYYVHRYALYRRRLYFTQRGVARIIARDYRWIHRPDKRCIVFPPAVPWRYDGKNYGELSQRLSNRIVLVMDRYPKSPCADPACSCIVHKLGLAKADEYGRLEQLRAEQRERRRNQSR